MSVPGFSVWVALSMAFSVSTVRSRSQESPMLWLSVLAGSLVLHLVLLLAGRWYLSQSANGRAGGGSQAPLDFVEVDPNAPPLKQAIAPSSTATENASIPKAAPEAAEPEPSQATAIENFRQTTPEQSLPETTPKPEPKKPDLFKPTQPDSRSTANSSPLNPTQPNRSSDTTQPNSGSSTRNPTSPTTQPNSNTSGTASSNGTKPPNSETAGNSSGSSGSTANSSGPTGGSSNPSGGSNVISSGNSLNGVSTFQGVIDERLESDPYMNRSAAPTQDEAATQVKLKSREIPQIALTDPIKLPASVLAIRVGLTIDGDGRVLKSEVRNDSPILQTHPELKDQIQGLVDQAFMSADNLFEVKFEGNRTSDRLAFRIANISLRAVQ